MRLRPAILAATAATILAVGVAGPPLGLGTSPVRAAAPDLSLVGDARYEVLPDERRVAVTVELRATNNLADTSANRFFFESVYLAVQPGATGFSISSPRLRPRVSVAATEPTHTLLRLAFGTRLAAGRTLALTLRFELGDPGSPRERDIRVSDSLATFPAWAFASDETPGATVVVALPAGYRVEFVRGGLAGPLPDDAGGQSWTSGPIDDPSGFEAAIRATRDPLLLDAHRSTSIADGTARVTFRAWRDDPGWLAEVSDLVLRALPALEAEIGRPWPLERPLVVEEGVLASADASAGRFDPAADRIAVAYYASDEVILHELAHAWFNGSLLADRWANETFASYYAALAAEAIGLPVAGSPEPRPAAPPLNAWGAPEGEVEADDAAWYAAGLALAAAVAERAGPDGLSGVWRAAEARERAYPDPVGGPAEAGGPPDWRGLLDLLEERTPGRYADLWRTFVVRPGEAALLDERATSRDEYAAVLATTGDWTLAPVVRDALAGWRFSVARSALASAATVLEARERLATRARAAGLALPETLREHFESGAFDAALVEAKAETEAVTSIATAAAARPATTDFLQAIGLVGAEPIEDLAAASAALTSGDPDAAVAAAARAETAWRTAADVGRQRVFGATLGGLAIVLLMRLVATRAWARRLGWS